MIIEITKKDLEKAGLLICKSCGWPETAHFDFDERSCAHDKECTGWKIDIMYGKILKKKSK